MAYQPDGDRGQNLKSDLKCRSGQHTVVVAVCRQIAKTCLRVIRSLVVRICKRIDLRTDIECRKNKVIDTDSQGAAEDSNSRQ